MADSVLPASLENLKINHKDDVCRDVVKGFISSHSTPAVNPFSYVGRTRKRAERMSELGSKCPLTLFGKKCSKLRPDSGSCECNRYIPSISSQKEKHLVKIKQRPVFKKSTILHKSKLNFIRFQNVKQCDRQTGAMPVSAHRPRRNTWSDTSNTDDLSGSEERNPPSSNSQEAGLLFGNCAAIGQDFHSLITPLQKQQLTSPADAYQSTSFRSPQFLPAKRFHRRGRKGARRAKRENDDAVDKVSTKLAVTGIRSATCSQQARLTANAYCDEHDISIDELAGYFEDFVHIPKKMSLMAEQMYN